MEIFEINIIDISNSYETGDYFDKYHSLVMTKSESLYYFYTKMYSTILIKEDYLKPLRTEQQLLTMSW